MAETYIAIMLQSLRKKEKVLDEIIRLNDLQKKELTEQTTPVEAFDQTIEDKSACIEQLNQLDSGFEKLYAQVEDELRENKEKYADTIKTMQQHIRRITDKSMMIQAQEARNKDLMVQKFSTVRQQARDVRANSRAITGYYNNMKHSMYDDVHMMEGKS